MKNGIELVLSRDRQLKRIQTDDFTLNLSERLDNRQIITALSALGVNVKMEDK